MLKYDTIIGHIRLFVLRVLSNKCFVAVFIAKEDEVGVARESKQNNKTEPKGQCAEIARDISSANKMGSNVTVKVNGVPDRKHIDDCDRDQEVSHDMSEAVKHGHLLWCTIFGNMSLNLRILEAEPLKRFPIAWITFRSR